MKLPGIRPQVSEVSAYKAGTTIEEVKRRYGLERVVKLGSNENPYGPFPAAKDAMREEIERLHTYPDASFVEIKRAIAAIYGVDPGWVAISHGAGGMLETLAKSFLEPDSHVILPATTYGLYQEISRLMGAEVEHVPLDSGFRVDIGAIRQALRPDTRLIWLCNPNNPSGTLVDQGEIHSLLRDLPANCWLVLDEAYAEFADQELLPDRAELLRQGARLVAVRTFSKAYGLAGARIGYALARPEMIEVIDTVAEPFNANRIGLAGAKATLEHETENVWQAVRKIRSERSRMSSELESRGFAVYPSQTNFLFADTGEDSAPLVEQLMKRGIIIRSCEGWGHPEFIRVSIGRREENSEFLRQLDELRGEQLEHSGNEVQHTKSAEAPKGERTGDETGDGPGSGEGEAYTRSRDGQI